MNASVQTNHESTIYFVEDDEDQRVLFASLAAGAGLAYRTFASGQDFLEAIPSDASGCVVVDMRMPFMSGLAVQRELIDRGQSLPIIVVTGHASVDTAVLVMKLGGFDLLEKPIQPRKLLRAIECALERDRQCRARRVRIDSYQGRLASLSIREHEIAERMMQGEASKVIALDLGISEKTVEVHRCRILRKMGVSSTVDLVREALEVERMATHLAGRAEEPLVDDYQTQDPGSVVDSSSEDAVARAVETTAATTIERTRRYGTAG